MPCSHGVRRNPLSPQLERRGLSDGADGTRAQAGFPPDHASPSLWMQRLSASLPPIVTTATRRQALSSRRRSERERGVPAPRARVVGSTLSWGCGWLSLDQTKIGQVVAEQMAALKVQYGEDCEIGDVCTVVEIVGPHGSTVPVRSSAVPLARGRRPSAVEALSRRVVCSARGERLWARRVRPWSPGCAALPGR